MFFSIVVQTQQVIRIICNGLITNAQQYISLHGSKVGVLVDDACQFYERRIFNEGIVDNIIQVAADAVKLNPHHL